jgi:hypothetical protein
MYVRRTGKQRQRWVHSQRCTHARARQRHYARDVLPHQPRQRDTISTPATQVSHARHVTCARAHTVDESRHHTCTADSHAVNSVVVCGTNRVCARAHKRTSSLSLNAHSHAIHVRQCANEQLRRVRQRLQQRTTQRRPQCRTARAQTVTPHTQCHSVAAHNIGSHRGHVSSACHSDTVVVM